MAGNPPGVGNAARFNSLPVSKYEGVRTALETASQAEVWELGVHNSLTLGCSSTPVNGLCSNFVPAMRDSLRGASRISSCRNALYSAPCWFRKEIVGLL